MTVRRITLPFKVKRPILACGADMKGAFAFARGAEAVLVDGFGDLGDLDNFTKYEQAIKKYNKKLKISPQIIACDLHPNYFSTRFAEHYPLCTIHYALHKVQHHESHIASAIVDNNIKGSVIGVAFDGTGYGSDGNIWGGEFFVGNLKGFKRAAHLEYVPMPGGEIVIREPWRMAISYLHHAFGGREITSRLVRNYVSSEVEKHNFGLARRIKMIIEKRINSPLTSSAGRLFDAVGSLVLGKDIVSKEAELPIELEKLVSGRVEGSYKFDSKYDKECLIINTPMIVKGVVKDLADGISKGTVSAKFHNTMAEVIAKIALKLSKKFNIKQVCLSGGVFQNRYLTERSRDFLNASGLRVYTHSRIPTNDSGISPGQIAIANEKGRS